MPNIEHERWNTALSRVAEIERKSATLHGRLLPKKFIHSKQSAWATRTMKPIAFDLSKMIINVNDIERVIEDMHVGLGVH